MNPHSYQQYPQIILLSLSYYGISHGGHRKVPFETINIVTNFEYWASPQKLFLCLFSISNLLSLFYSIKKKSNFLQPPIKICD